MTVVVVPGLLCDAAIWAPQAAALDDEVVVVPSTGPASITGLAEQALDLAPRRFALAGHSMGGRIAFEVVRLAPERVERLAVLDTGTHPPAPGERESRGRLVELAASNGMAALVDAWLLPMLHPDHRAAPAIVEPLVAMVLRSTPARFATQQEALLTRPDAGAHLHAITCPTLVLVGSHDTWSPVAQHAAIADAIDCSTLVVVESSGHMTTVEQPAAVSTAMRRWLDDPVS